MQQNRQVIISTVLSFISGGIFGIGVIVYQHNYFTVSHIPYSQGLCLLNTCTGLGLLDLVVLATLSSGVYYTAVSVMRSYSVEGNALCNNYYFCGTK